MDINMLDDFDTQVQADEKKVTNDWDYNEWPDWVDEDEELIDKRSMRCHNRSTENCECPECDEDMSDDEFVEKFGEALKEAKNREYSLFDLDSWKQVEGKKIKLTKDIFYSYLDSFYYDDEHEDGYIPPFAELRNTDEVWFPAGTVFTVKEAAGPAGGAAVLVPEADKNVEFDFGGDEPVHAELAEAIEKEDNAEDAENVEEADLNSQVADALQAFIPEDDEEFDVNTLIDAVLAFFSDEAAIEHIKEVVCPEEEVDETSEDAVEEE